MKLSAAGTPSYAAAWDMAHQAFLPEDRARDEWLRARCHFRPSEHVRPPLTSKQHAALKLAQARWRAKKLEAQPPAPCEICGRPRKGWTGKRCEACQLLRKCFACGAVIHRHRKLCVRCAGAR